MAIIISSNVVDCSFFLNSVLIYRFDQIEMGVDQAVADLHGALFKLYDEIQGHDLHKMVMVLDHLMGMDFQLDSVTSVIRKPTLQPFFVFDFKVNDGSLFFAAYYSFGNDFQAVCEKHNLIFHREKMLWYKKIAITEAGVLGAMSELSGFFNDIKCLSKVFFYKSTLQKFFRVG